MDMPHPAHSRLSRIRYFAKMHKGHALSLTFFVGFFFDFATLTRIDDPRNHFIILGYLLLIVMGIFISRLLELRRREGDHVLGNALPFLFQFSFGGILSAFFVYYSRSASFIENWPFFFILLLVVWANEKKSHHYHHLHYQIALFSFVLFGYASFTLPIVLGKMGTPIFLFSALLSAFLVSLVLVLAMMILPRGEKRLFRKSFLLVLTIHLTTILLYLLHVIPPLPLTLQSGVLLHGIERVEGNYIGSMETQSWWQEHMTRTQALHVNTSEEITFYTSVFAPTELTTQIIHEWQYFDSRLGEWVTASNIAFPIVGGRDRGYRGYTQKSTLFPGEWRVNVKIPGGGTLGRTQFVVSEGDPPRPLQKVILP